MKEAIHKWRDRERWARASTLPLWFLLTVYGGGTAALGVKEIVTGEFLEQWRRQPAASAFLYGWGLLAVLFCTWLLTVIRRARRESALLKGGRG
jgi:hypothetical protein